MPVYINYVENSVESVDNYVDKSVERVKNPVFVPFFNRKVSANSLLKSLQPYTGHPEVIRRIIKCPQKLLIEKPPGPSPAHQKLRLGVPSQEFWPLAAGTLTAFQLIYQNRRVPVEDAPVLWQSGYFPASGVREVRYQTARSMESRELPQSALAPALR